MNKTLKIILTVVVLVVLSGIAYGLYLYFMPARDIQAQEADHAFPAQELVAEYLADSKAADQKYLDEEGESMVLLVAGTVSEVTEDFNGQQVVLLKGKDEQAGVSCTFLPENGEQAGTLQAGQEVRIKGVIRSGAAYDADLEMYEDVVMADCALVE